MLAEKQAQQRRYIAEDGAQAPVDQLSRQWSAYADASLDSALAASWRSTRQAAPHVPADLDPEGPVPGLFILGLGKLGGEDLNFSSDVDLVAFYNAETVPVPAFVGRTDITARVLRTLNQTVDGHGSGRFVWRTDWRLRPDPSVTDLSMSTEAAEDYHFYRAAPWRRLAMIKARVVAGDRAAGEKLLADLHPYLWRRHLDFSMIEEVAHLKTRIRAEHPDLAGERRHETPLEQTAGFNLKLGRGGIRDIEFFVNAQQLLWGGRHPRLQTPVTMEALQGLADEAIIDPDLAGRLKRSYHLLRGLENRVQYWADAHTHFVPTDAGEQSWLAERSGFANWQALADALVETRRFIDDSVSGLFSEFERPQAQVPGQAATAPSEPASAGQSTGEPDPDVLLLDQRLQAWRTEAGSGAAPDKILRLAQESDDPAASIAQVDDLFRRLGNRGQYLKLLSQDPKLFDAVLPPLFHAPAMASLLHQSAHVVDGLLGRAGALPSAPELEQGRAMAAAAGTYEGKLEAARAWVNEQLYLAYLSVFSGAATTQDAERNLTALAEAALTLIAETVTGEMGLDHFPLCVLGLGKLGMNAMAPHSDLDLIFVVEEGWSLEDANAVAARFNTAFNAQMREGRVWELDTRLRPSGRSGPPTISLASFESHHLQGARTWEHLAQVPMRPLSGSPALQDRVRGVRDAILRRPRDPDQLTADAYRMLLRLRDQRIYDRPDEQGEVKLRPGGLMEVEYLLAVLTLRHGARLPLDQSLVHDDLIALWAAKDPSLQPLVGDLRRLRDWFFAGRLLGPHWFEQQGVTPAEISALTERVRTQVQVHIDDPAQALGYDWVEYQEQPVKWQD
jgi:glutamate-ammonia-ligase adenylyltransferase